MGQGTSTIFPHARRRASWACRPTRSRWRRWTRPSCPTAVPRSPAGRRWSSAACASRRPAACGPRSRSATRAGPSPTSTWPTRQLHGRTRIDQAFEPYPGISFDDQTYTGDAYPAFGWAACVAAVEVDLDTGEVAVRDVVAVDDVGKVIHPILCEGQVEGGTLQAVGYATIEEIKLDNGRYLNDRLATYLIPTALDAPRIDDDPRRGALQRRAPRREGRRRAADGRRRPGGRGRHPRRRRRLDHGAAGDARADPRRARCPRARRGGRGAA